MNEQDKETLRGEWWWPRLSEREQQEVLLAVTYTRQFGHGTAGHLSYTLIARLTDFLVMGPQNGEG
jgi:hypothetical protein